jgi:hypothetical protein
MATAQESADCMCECVRLAAFTDDPQHRDQLIRLARQWLPFAKPALQAARGGWPYRHAGEREPCA